MVQKLIHTLIVDPQQVVRQGISREVAKHNDIRIIGEASNGYEAIKLAIKLRPDILILDIFMPGPNAIHVTRYLRNLSLRGSQANPFTQQFEI